MTPVGTSEIKHADGTFAFESFRVYSRVATRAYRRLSSSSTRPASQIMSEAHNVTVSTLSHSEASEVYRELDIRLKLYGDPLPQILPHSAMSTSNTLDAILPTLSPPPYLKYQVTCSLNYFPGSLPTLCRSSARAVSSMTSRLLSSNQHARWTSRMTE